MDVQSRAGALALCAATFLIMFQARAQEASLKEMLETSAARISMPTTADGLMTVAASCRNCKARILRSTLSTVYKLRDLPVSFAVFRQAVAGTDAYVAVELDQSTSELVSVTANMDPPAAGKR